MQILIKEDQFKRIFLSENRESKNLSIARNVVRKYNPEIDPIQVLNAIRTDIPSSRLKQCRFLPGVTRMYLQGQIKDGTAIGELNQTLKILTSAHSEEYNQDLNGMSAGDLINRFKGAVRDDIEQKKAANAEKQYDGKTDYEVVLIPDAKAASKYSKYVSWCVCRSEAMYDSYTHDGTGLFYFLLRNGFEDVAEEKGENCPLDEFGLSMIAVSINEDGSINTVTCRWNHDNGGNDNIMTDEQLSILLGQDVYSVLKPVGVEVLADNERFKVFKKNGIIRAFDKKLEDYCNFDKYGFATIGLGYQQLRGKINTKGEIVIPEKYFACNEVESDGCFIVGLYGTGLVNINGKEVFKPNDDNGLRMITSASPSGTRLYKDSTGNRGLINVKLGKNIKPGTYKLIGHIDLDGRRLVVDHNENSGLLNDDLSIAIEPGIKYTWIDCCEKLGEEPLRVVVDDNEKYGIIDKNLKEVIPPRFSNITQYFRLVSKGKNGKTKGKLMIKDGKYVILWDDGNNEIIRNV